MFYLFIFFLFLNYTHIVFEKKEEGDCAATSTTTGDICGQECSVRVCVCEYNIPLRFFGYTLNIMLYTKASHFRIGQNKIF